MLKSDLVQTDKHSIKILLRRKNLRFLSRTNHNTNTVANYSKLILFNYQFFINCILNNLNFIKMYWRPETNSKTG